MPSKPKPFIPRKLLVAALGVATINYVGVAACGGISDGNDTSTYPPTSGNLPNPPPTSGNLPNPTFDASVKADASGDAGDAGDAADSDADGDSG